MFCHNILSSSKSREVFQIDNGTLICPPNYWGVLHTVDNKYFFRLTDVWIIASHKGNSHWRAGENLIPDVASNASRRSGNAAYTARIWIRTFIRLPIRRIKISLGNGRRYQQGLFSRLSDGMPYYTYVFLSVSSVLRVETAGHKPRILG